MNLFRKITGQGRFKICFILKNRIITLPEGAYSPDNLANVIQNKLNEQIESYANSLGHQFVATGIDNTVDVNTLARTRRPAFTNATNVVIQFHQHLQFHIVIQYHHGITILLDNLNL